MSINYFDEIFFSSYLRKDSGDEVLDVCHKHIITITDTVVIGLFFWVIIPAFFYYNNSFALRDLVPFLFFEVYLFITYIFLIFKIFDWYNDVWIITSKGIIDLDWQIMKTNIVYIDYNDVKGIDIQQASAWDGLLNKGEIAIHLQGGTASFVLEEAKNPKEIAGYIQGILEEKEKKKKEKDVTLNDKFFNTIKGVIKDYLEREGIQESEPDDEETESPEQIAAEKALKKKGTIDLRINAE